ncbi:hypothetical protein CHLRE_07g335950v5 [Chlamydomonas reinhardtii]|uniref:BTB domain-containing protein n=1 Tax=Chlamydomonas reinhardtii TaxID=3055 RepID=A0A2K3DK75_CHLRE|nr:uncharacterized protein CHLRE_07g335950v5 [Chlamydomonas reinhardtii]PNW80935.1 hypothetical protein CHLRE_07g335950v5 [Chlamydomonas reinhardtii]
MFTAGSYEWAIPEFERLTAADKQVSPTFVIGGSSWRMLCFPRQNATPHQNVSVFLEYPEASFTPNHLSPTASFKLIIKNFKDPSKNFEKSADNTFKSHQEDWGFSQMLPLQDLNKESGYLREDGAMVVRVEISVPAPLPGGSYPVKLSTATPGLSTDLLSLLDNPGTTSDLTITATGSELPGATGCDAGADARPQSRSFAVHRAILAARCPYFRTLFESGLADSGARELNLPDTDPDALRLLVRFMYGDGLAVTSREQAYSCLSLADRLLLTQAVELLREHLLSSVSAATFAADLLCAAGLAGEQTLLRSLVARFADLGDDVPEADLKRVEAERPQLLLELLLSCRAAKRART